MSKDNERYWAAEIAKASEAMAYQQAMARRMEPYIQGAEALRRQMEPYLRGLEMLRRQMEPYIRASEALRRQAEPMVKAAERFARDTQWPKLSGGLGLPISLRVAFTVNAEIQGLARAYEPTARDVDIEGVPGTVTAEAPPGTVTGTGDLRLPPMGISGQGTVEEPSSGQAERGIGQILALVLVAIIASGLLGVQGPDRAAVDHYLTVIGVALPIAVAIWNKQNKPK